MYLARIKHRDIRKIESILKSYGIKLSIGTEDKIKTSDGIHVGFP